MSKAKKASKKRTQELESQQRRNPEDDFDFMVAGVNFDGRHRIIERCLSTHDRVKIVPEPHNSHDSLKQNGRMQSRLCESITGQIRVVIARVGEPIAVHSRPGQRRPFGSVEHCGEAWT